MTKALKLLRFDPFTGWHMLAILVLFFGVIISVNLTMAIFAHSSWSGLLVKNTYVESQKFDQEVAFDREMQSKGWASELVIDGTAVTYRLTDAQSDPVLADRISVDFNRPVGTDQDQSVILTAAGPGYFTGFVELASGQWIAKISAFRGDEMVYREALRRDITPGGIDG